MTLLAGCLLGDHLATLAEITLVLGFTPRRLWLIQGLTKAMEAFWAAGIHEVFIDGSFCTNKPDPGDIDGYWVEPDEEIYDRLDPYWFDFRLVMVPSLWKRKWRMWAVQGWSVSFIRQWTPRRTLASQSSSAATGTGDRRE
jgi:hypothetical protein